MSNHSKYLNSQYSCKEENKHQSNGFHKEELKLHSNSVFVFIKCDNWVLKKMKKLFEVNQILERSCLLIAKTIVKPLQNKKVKKIWGTREKSSLFPYKRTAFFSGTPNFFGPSYFEAALAVFQIQGI